MIASSDITTISEIGGETELLFQIILIVDCVIITCVYTG